MMNVGNEPAQNRREGGISMARILIVDDNLLMRTLLREILSGAGHEIVGEASDGLEAPARVRELHPDLVTLDLVMPGRSGIATLVHLLKIDPALVVVICSASLDQRRVIESLRLGARGLIIKPFNRSTVLEGVDKALAWDDGYRTSVGPGLESSVSSPIIRSECIGRPRPS
jgi:two-component system, chemotaxis family, chemotaxis protein CheY